jgi:uncharacterized protein (TIGR02246 family)
MSPEKMPPMNRANVLIVTVLSSLALTMLPAGRGQDEPAGDPNAAALDALKVSAERFVEAFNRADAEAVAATYLPGGEITLQDGTVLAGREAITAFYREGFEEDGETKPRAAIEVDSVRFVTPGVAIESGTLLITKAGDVTTSHPYTAVQIMQEDGTWLTGSVRDELGGAAPPSEKLLALEWLVGDWIIQQGEVETLLSFDWSDFGPYLEGGAEVAQTYVGAVGLSIRIGWDAAREGFVSWGHDSEGGYVQSEWTETESGTWLMRSKGVTSEGEANEYLQVCEIAADQQSFTWTIRDQTIGGALQPNRVLTAVKRPPLPNPVGAQKAN